jgi:3-oxoacyl-[acyl-carrier protein] reductase
MSVTHFASNTLTRRSVIGAAVAASGALAAGRAEGLAGYSDGVGAQPRRANGKVAIVTGSTRGIGAAIAQRLARDGYRVTVNGARNRDSATAIVRDIEQAGGEAIWHLADVSDPRAVRTLFDATERAFSGIDIVVSNAGVMRLAPIREMSNEDFGAMIDINMKGSFYVLREAARRVRDHGRIITVSSSITLLRSPTYGPYAATKAAQEYFANILAKELQGRGISVNAVAPGVVDTTLFTDSKSDAQIATFVQRTPHGRLGQPSDIADVVAALCGPDMRWVNGQTVFANGGIV